MLNNNLIALLITFIIAILWLRIIDWVANKGLINSQDSRKIIHIGTGPIFVLCWLFFNNDMSGRYLAAIVPLAITIQFLLIGFGVIKDQASVKAMSRTGNRKEILKGPVFYGLSFIAVTLVYWKESVIGIVALMLLCGGDGLADIIGNRLGKIKLPWSLQKSVAGSTAMFLGSLLFSITIIFVFDHVGIFQIQFPTFIPKLLVICGACTLVESLRFSDIDNLTVPIVAIMLGHILSI
jgi:phytol kinase